MALAKKPNSNQLLSKSNQITPEQKAFISGSKENKDAGQGTKTVPVMLRVPADLLARIDHAAKMRGLKRSAFFVSAAAAAAMDTQ